MKALFLNKQNTKNFYFFKKQSFVVLKAFQDDMCSTFVQRQTKRHAKRIEGTLKQCKTQSSSKSINLQSHYSK